MTRVFELQELGRVEFLKMVCSNSKGALCSFRASIRDGRDILCINIEKAEHVDLGTLSAEFRQFIHYLIAYSFGGAYSIADLTAEASDSLF